MRAALHLQDGKPKGSCSCSETSKYGNDELSK